MLNEALIYSKLKELKNILHVLNLIVIQGRKGGKVNNAKKSYKKEILSWSYYPFNDLSSNKNIYDYISYEI